MTPGQFVILAVSIKWQVIETDRRGQTSPLDTVRFIGIRNDGFAEVKHAMCPLHLVVNRADLRLY